MVLVVYLTKILISFFCAGLEQLLMGDSSGSYELLCCLIIGDLFVIIIDQ